MSNITHTKFLSVALPDQPWRDIIPLQFGEERCAPRHSFGPTFREFWLLHFVVSGKGTFTRGGQTHTVEANQCFVIRPYEITYYQADDSHPWHYIWMGFRSEVELPPLLQQDVFDASRYGSVFADVLHAEQYSAGREAFVCAKVWELLALMTEDQHPRQTAPAQYVSLAKTYIEVEYMRGITVAEIARRLNLDRSYFSTLFKRQTGQSPQQYLNTYRLDKAAALLTQHDYSASLAASATGYSDIFLFSRMFKRHFGVPPTQYVKDHAAQSKGTDQ